MPVGNSRRATRSIYVAQYTAIMGSVYSRHVLGYENPEIGLMSIGGEDFKGTELTKEVFKMLKQSQLNFRGNVEGHDLFAHPVEVVVCDGFVGNVILKTCESVGDAIFKWLKHELMKNKLRMAGAYLAQNAFKAIKKKVNYEEYGGSVLYSRGMASASSRTAPARRWRFDQVCAGWPLTRLNMR